MAKEQKVKNQHIVPQSYLERFTAARSQTWAFDKTNRKVFLTTVRNVASETYFYDFPSEMIEKAFGDSTFVDQLKIQFGDDFDTPALKRKMETQITETFLNKTDKGLKDTLDEILHEVSITRKGRNAFRRKIIYRGTKEDMAFFAAVQIVRTKGFREEFQQLGEAVGQRMLEEIVRVKRPELKGEFRVRLDSSSLPIMQAQFLLSPANMASLVRPLVNHIWILGVCHDAPPLYTSDNPVVRLPHLKDPLISTSGLASPGIEIAYPLSDQVLLIMLERTHFSNMHSYDGRAIRIGEEQVRRYNSLQVLQSYRYVFSSSNDFDLANEVCNKNPDYTALDRPRIGFP